MFLVLLLIFVCLLKETKWDKKKQKETKRKMGEKNPWKLI